MTLKAIKEAIEQLPPEQQTVLASWLSERDWKAWDEQIERDFSAGGRGMPMLAELEREIAEGKTRPMQEGLAERRKSRQ
jgi:hypothetical protein